MLTKEQIKKIYKLKVSGLGATEIAGKLKVSGSAVNTAIQALKSRGIIELKTQSERMKEIYDEIAEEIRKEIK